MENRFRFVKDDDGHHYIIPASKHKDFEIWVDHAPYWDDYTGEDFTSYGIEGYFSDYTFTDPAKN